MSPAALRLAPAVVLALTLACDTGGTASETGSTGDSTTTGVWAEVPTPADFCGDAFLVAHGLYAGDMRQSTPDDATHGVCGGGGPDTFIRVEVAVRADLRVEARGVGFVPRLSLAPDDCLGGREIACAAEGPLELRDLAGGTVVRVSVGIDPAVFSDLSKEPAPEHGPDPLAFALDIGLARVLEAGDVCQPASRGRCVDGTACMASAEGVAPTCTTLPADTCSTALRTPIALDPDGTAVIAVDPSAPQTDAHHHGCGGEGTRERVLRLVIPPSPPGRALEIVADHPDVGLAVRAPACLAADELACAAGTADPARVVIGDLLGLRAAGVEPYLFIELPDRSEDDPPFDLRLRLVPDPTGWGTPSD